MAPLRASILFLATITATVGVACGQRTVFGNAEPSSARRHHPPTPPIDTSRLADLIDSLVNEERGRQGLSPLEREPGLDRIGKRHSRDMAENGYFDHIDLRGRNATQRAHAGRYVCLSSMEKPTPVPIGENLFTAFRYSEYRLTYYPGEVVAEYDWKTEEEFAHEAVDAWMDSPPHRENLLHPAYHQHGIGIYVSASLEVFVTQNLC